MVRQGVNQLFLFGTYDAMKKAFFGLEREDPIQVGQCLRFLYLESLHSDMCPACSVIDDRRHCWRHGAAL